MRNAKTTINRLFYFMMSIYLIFLFIITSFACYYAYKEKEEQILSELNMGLSYISQEYNDILDNFWQAYMPIYEESQTAQQVYRNYFSLQPAADLSPMDKRDLINALSQMKARDSRIQWIALFSENREYNYMLNNNAIEVLTEDFPYHSIMQETFSGRVICNAEITAHSNSLYTFAICGNSPANMGPGKILIGYSVNGFEQGSNLFTISPSSARYLISSGENIIYDSRGTYDTSSFPVINQMTEDVVSFQNHRYRIKSQTAGTNDSFISYSILESELLRIAHKDTPLLLCIMFCFTILACIVHSLMNRSVTKEITVIRQGLDRIAENSFDSPLPTDFMQGGLPEIAANINDMTSKLNENIKKAYYFELKQKDAQLAELQATFNPHFLYNTLEMLRSKSYNNGDLETSELISQLSAIFRGFINAKTFIPLREELAFSNRYFSLLNARYDNQIRISYDIPGELLSYGIIRNVFQIIIENYFVHGFDSNNSKNHIVFSGKSLDNEFMIFDVADNGVGMKADELSALTKRIEEPIRHGDNSYGLKNLNQRIKLFYGADCGLTVSSGPEGGITVQIKIRKMTVDDYEILKGKPYTYQ